MNSTTARKPTSKPVSLEEDGRIVAGTLKGADERKKGLAKHFDIAEDAISYLRDL